MAVDSVQIPGLKEWARQVIEAQRSAHGAPRYLLGIAGYPGAGKSTFASGLVDAINAEAGYNIAALVPMDGFHLPNEELDSLGLLPLKGIPDTFDGAAFVKLIENLKHSRLASVFCPVFDRSIEASIENGLEVTASQTIAVVEGNYLLLESKPWEKLHELFNEIWFLDTSFETIIPRLLERHMAGGKDERHARVKMESTDLPNARLVEKSRHRAHRIIEM